MLTGYHPYQVLLSLALPAAAAEVMRGFDDAKKQQLVDMHGDAAAAAAAEAAAAEAARSEAEREIAQRDPDLCEGLVAECAQHAPLWLQLRHALGASSSPATSPVSYDGDGGGGGDGGGRGGVATRSVARGGGPATEAEVAEVTATLLAAPREVVTGIRAQLLNSLELLTLPALLGSRALVRALA